MNKDRIYQVLLGPHISEKATTVADKYNQVVFKVLPNASKLEIKKSVEHIFGVDIIKVTVQNMQGKIKRTRRGIGKCKDWKKAIVTLKEGQDIDFSGMAEA